VVRDGLRDGRSAARWTGRGRPCYRLHPVRVVNFAGLGAGDFQRAPSTRL